MRKTPFLLCAFIALGVSACDKHDPILPGERSAIFEGSQIKMIDQPVPNLPTELAENPAVECPYKLDSSNTIWNGEKRIFSGFATNNSVAVEKPVLCRGEFVYAGLSTGELVKVNTRNRQIVWIADIFRQSNMTGGASVLDIIAPIQTSGNYVYAAGMGGAFCKIADKDGNKMWCLDINVEKPFIIANDTAFVLDTDKQLYAIRLSDGSVYWKNSVKKSGTPKYKSKTIIIRAEKFDAENGKLIK